MTTDTTFAPQIQLPPAYTARPGDYSDLPAITELLNACSLELLGVADSTEEDTRAEWDAPGFDPAGSTRVVLAPSGKLVGYIEVWDNREPPVKPFAWGRVHPDFQGQGIGSGLMAWAEGRARQAIRRAPPEARVALNAGCHSHHAPSKSLLESCGMSPNRYFYNMLIDLDGPPAAPRWPEGVTFQAYRHPEQAPQVYQAVREAFKDHWGHVPEPYETGLQRWSRHHFSRPEFDPSLWLLAMDGGQIAGFSLCQMTAPEDPHNGFVATLGVLRPWRQRGLGLALLQESFRTLWERGRRHVSLFVDADSLTGATRLYEKAGMRVRYQMDNYEKELRPGIELGTQSVE
jgi:mycothiol synthase